MALRDLKISENVGVAVLDSGDVVFWGQGYTAIQTQAAITGRKRKSSSSMGIPKPEVTLAGKDIAKVEISNDVVYALSKKGAVFAIPVSKERQQTGPKLQESAWFGLSSNQASISYSRVRTNDQASFSDIAAGNEHLLLLSKTGSVYACSSSTKGNARGQMGQRDWRYEPESNALEAVKIEGFNNATATAIAAGDQHSAVIAGGEVYTFGANTYGQLAFNFNAESTDVVTPTSVMVNALYPRNLQAKCLSIAAGGRNTYMVIQSEEPGKPDSRRVDIWCSGTSQFGQLGNNTWNHYQSKPVKVKQISGLTEWDEVNNCVLPIGVYKLSVGSTHVICALDNVAKVDADPSASRKAFDTINYGRDCLCWGSSSDYQLGSGKRASAPLPIYISPLESAAEKLALKSGWEEIIDEGHKRFHLTPAKVIEVTLANGKRAKRNVEQMIVAGHLTSACYSRLVE
jgi:alpha-tubulin suppressor-like RCC1 family protein